MPIYDYTCKRCVKQVELIKPMVESEKVEICQSCGEPMVHVLASPPAFKITGSSSKNDWL